MNSYCTIAQFQAFCDARLIAELSSDDGSGAQIDAKIQTILDAEASELDGFLTGKYALPLVTPPAVLTKYVAIRSMDMMFGRRTDMPKRTQADLEWAQGLMERFVAGTWNLPGVDRANQIELLYTADKDGSSRFDHVEGLDQLGNTQTSVQGNQGPGVLG